MIWKTCIGANLEIRSLHTLSIFHSALALEGQPLSIHLSIWHNHFPLLQISRLKRKPANVRPSHVWNHNPVVTINTRLLPILPAESHNFFNDSSIEFVDRWGTF